MDTNIKHLSLGTLLAVSAAFAMSANATDSLDKVPEVRVSYADLDVNRPAGAARLYHRIRIAASKVCGPDGRRDLTRLLRRKDCMEQATRRAVAAVNAPELTRYYTAQMGESRPAKRVASR